MHCPTTAILALSKTLSTAVGVADHAVAAHFAAAYLYVAQIDRCVVTVGKVALCDVLGSPDKLLYGWYLLYLRQLLPNWHAYCYLRV